MKSLFPQFCELADKDYDSAWKQALFVFDTNVLLNLYRYQSSTRDELLNVLRQLSDRIWVPHHVALEFQRNRLKVIAEQNKRFTDVRRTVEKARDSLFLELEKLQLRRRHSLIDPQSLTTGFEALVVNFLSDLDRLQGAQQKLSAPDPLKAKIEALFEGHVGPAPKDQAAIDALYKEAEHRFKLKIPPGYQDTDKDKDGPDEHVSGGIVYKRKYGDFLVWQQLLAEAKSTGKTYLVFVTDDGKEDWWLKIDCDGPKTIGPRPELKEEARLQAGVRTLLMYNPEGFLKYAKEFLKAPVSEETLKEVRDLSTIRSLQDNHIWEIQQLAMHAEQSVLRWLERRFDRVAESRRGPPDFFVEHEGAMLGFEVKLIQHVRNNPFDRISRALSMAQRVLNSKQFSEVTVVWVATSQSDAEEFKQQLIRHASVRSPHGVKMITGFVDDLQKGDGAFCPID